MIRTCHPTYFGVLGGITSLTLGALVLRDPYQAHSNGKSLFIAQGDQWIDTHGATRGNVASQQCDQREKRSDGDKCQRVSGAYIKQQTRLPTN
jgi:hypothetical protein